MVNVIVYLVHKPGSLARERIKLYHEVRGKKREPHPRFDAPR